MTRPDDIPEDVWTVSKEHALDMLGQTQSCSCNSCVETVALSYARAILADRERAEIAATDTITQLLGDPLADSINGYVAAAIRSGKQ